jgi:hypothetical protein
MDPIRRGKPQAARSFSIIPMRFPKSSGILDYAVWNLLGEIISWMMNIFCPCLPNELGDQSRLPSPAGPGCIG